MSQHKPWKVCFLPELVHPSNEHTYEYFNQVKGFVESHLKTWKTWCKRYNTSGLVVLDELRVMVAETEQWFYQNPSQNERIIEGLLDPHTQTVVRVRIRKVPA